MHQLYKFFFFLQTCGLHGVLKFGLKRRHKLDIHTFPIDDAPGCPQQTNGFGSWISILHASWLFGSILLLWLLFCCWFIWAYVRISLPCGYFIVAEGEIARRGRHDCGLYMMQFIENSKSIQQKKDFKVIS